MPNMGVKKYQNGEMKWVCGSCLKENTDQVVEEIPFSEEMGAFNNLHFVCSHCPGTLFVNMNIPEGDYDELEFELDAMPFYEIDARKQIRDAIFDRRADMKKLKKAEKQARRDAKKDKAAKFKEDLHGRIRAEAFEREGRKKFKEKKEKEAKEKKDKGVK